MSTLRKVAARHDGRVASYKNEVTEEQVRQINQTVQKEFESGDWVTVERES